MKKRKLVGWPIVLIISVVLIGVCVFFGFTQQGLSILKWDVNTSVPFYVANAFGGSKTFLGLCKNALLESFIAPFVAFSLNPITIAYYACFALSIVVIIIQIIYYSKMKKPSMIFWIIATIAFGFFSMMVCVLAQQYFGVNGELFIDKATATTVNGYTVNQSATIKNLLLNPNAMFGGAFAKKGLVMCIIGWVFVVSLVLFAVSYLVILIQTLVYASSHRHDKELKAQNANNEDVNYDGVGIGGTTNNINTVGNSSPLVIQYINSYGPEAPVSGTPAKASEQPAAPVNPTYPPYYGYPFPPYGYPYPQQPEQPKAEEKSLTKEDVKEIVKEALNEHCDCSECCDCDEEEITCTNENGEELEYVDLDELKDLIKDQVSSAIKDEFASKPQAEEKKEEKKEAELVPEETSAYEEKPLDKEVKFVSAENTNGFTDQEKTKVHVTTPIVVAVPTTLEPEEKEPEVAPEEPKETITEEDVRTLVSEEIKDALKGLEKPRQKRIIKKIITKEVPEVVSKEEPKEEVKEEPVEEAKEEIIPEPVVEEKAPVIEEKPAKVEPKVIVSNEPRGKESTIEKGEIVKMNFFEKISTGDETLKTNYNAIKNLIMSYGLKDRLSNTGDTFRLHKVTYAKITCLGDSLKIYLALDPKEFMSTALPVQDVSKKDSYKEIPLAFKIRSDLSLRRANELVLTAMRKAGFEPIADYQEVDYVKEIDELLAKTKEKKLNN